MSAQPPSPVFVATTRVVNSRKVAVKFHIEPWGDEYEMPGGAAFDVVARAPEPGTLEVDIADDHITVWAWSGCVLQVFHEGAELGAGAWPREAVPRLPPGQSTSQFLKNILGAD